MSGREGALVQLIVRGYDIDGHHHVSRPHVRASDRIREAQDDPVQRGEAECVPLPMLHNHSLEHMREPE